MSMGLLVTAILGVSGSGIVQPICSQEDFQQAFGNSMQGDTAFIAHAVFDDYLEKLNTISQDSSCEEVTDAPPVGVLMARLGKEKAADEVFDTLLSSLSALNEDVDWEIRIANLRRTVLLRARMAKNPWKGVVWADVPNITTVPGNVLLQIDSFLQKNIDEDRTDRYNAIAMQMYGETTKCRKYEEQAMNRWAEYLLLVSPYINRDVLQAIYPQLDTGKKVHLVKHWVFENITEENTLESVRQQISLWNAVHNKQNQVVVGLVVKARAQLGFDPWSRGCGIQFGSSGYKIKNELLQKSAEIQEFNNSTIDVILNLLTKKQRQLFEEE
jgi:hypothetical protein